MKFDALYALGDTLPPAETEPPTLTNCLLCGMPAPLPDRPLRSITSFMRAKAWSELTFAAGADAAPMPDYPKQLADHDGFSRAMREAYEGGMTFGAMHRATKGGGS